MSEAVMAGTTLANFKVTKQVTDWMDDIEKGKVKEEQLLKMFDQMIDRDKKTMVDNASKLEVFKEYKSHGKVEGTFEGQDIKISDGWGDHNFTEDEIKKLFNGETITIESKGKKFTGKLMEQEIPNGKGKTYWGFGLIYDTYTGVYAPEGKEITFARKAMGHEFSDAECEELLAGKTVKFEAYSEKKKKSYTAEVLLQYGPGYKDTKKKWRIVFKPFDKKKKSKKR
jgi:DNA topoisomerase-3